MGSTAELVEKYICDKAIRGAVIVFGTPAEIVFSGSWGLADHLTCRAMTADSIFDMASVTKAVCIGTLLARAVEDRKIFPDAPYTEYLPAYRGRSAYTATVRDLALHYSGLDSSRPYNRQMLNGSAALMDAMLDLRVVQIPRTEYCYTCANYILLGLILEAVYGAPLDDLAEKSIFTPLGMTRSSWGMPRPEVLADVVHPRLTGNHGAIPTDVFPPELRGLAANDDLPSDETARVALPHCTGNAGLFSCADDLSKFARFLLRKPFTEEAWRFLTRNQAPEGMRPRSAGWDMEDTGVFGEHAIHHTGWSGQSLWIEPEAQVFGMVLTNRCGDHAEGKSCRLELMRAVRMEIGR